MKILKNIWNAIKSIFRKTPIVYQKEFDVGKVRALVYFTNGDTCEVHFKGTLEEYDEVKHASEYLSDAINAFENKEDTNFLCSTNNKLFINKSYSIKCLELLEIGSHYITVNRTRYE